MEEICHDGNILFVCLLYICVICDVYIFGEVCYVSLASVL